MNTPSLKNKLLATVCALVIGSSLAISILVTHRFSDSLQAATTTQGKYLAKALALEATDKILTNDLVALRKLLNYQLASNPDVAYLFVIRDGQVLAHTFKAGIPAALIDANPLQSALQGKVRLITAVKGQHYLDIAWPIFESKAGVLRLGINSSGYRKKISTLWWQMASMTMGILALALVTTFWFVNRLTLPLTALAGAARRIVEGDLEVAVTPAGSGEVGQLTTAINRMLTHIRDHTRRLEMNAEAVARAHRQTRSSLDIIQEIGSQVRLEDVCAYLIRKFQEIVSCDRLELVFFSADLSSMFRFFDNTLLVSTEQWIEPVHATLNDLQGLSFTDRQVLPEQMLPGTFRSAAQIAVFPLRHDDLMLGALLVGCPGGCNCDLKALEVINLILGQTAGVIRRTVAYEEEMRGFQGRIEATTEYCGIIGKDAAMQTIYKLIDDIGPTDAAVLIQGESGTGKELVASAIHHQSLRRDQPFVVINCSAYPVTLLESELFGHEKGAFTGAVRQKIGRFEQADGGTVFLDEIGEVPPASQIKLLRVLQTQKFERLGGEKTLQVDIRIISATNRNLLEQVQNGRFREDLYYRLDVIPVVLPPLRDRRNDIPLLARSFMQRFAAEQEKTVSAFSSDAMRLLLEYPWPGNVRELENTIEHAVVLARGDQIQISDLPPVLHQVQPSAAGPAKISMMAENEARLLRQALDSCGGNKKKAAQHLGISRNTLYRKLKKYSIQTA